tara:strand:+ start:278 stop:667 length:390 start_codon:yes stop_codon:yes gene_type:complete
MSLLSNLIKPVGDILDKVIPDQDLRRKLSHEIATMAEKQSHEVIMAQLEVLKADAQGNWFQSSWRPMIGWVGAISLMVNYLISPICQGFGIDVPQADMSVMMPILTGMLGIATLRSVDKYNKTDTKGKK